MQRHRIGVIDSGMGGLTVVRSLCSAGVPLDIVYVGDNANVPYGNRPLTEIVALTERMLDVLDGRGVEAVAIACNTISATVDMLEPRSKIPLVDIIRPAARAMAGLSELHVGLFATEFTVQSGLHAKLVHKANPAVTVHGVASARLAALIDSVPWDEAAIREEIASMIAKMRKAGPVRTVLLGCTHYPIVQNVFEELAPDMRFIDPAGLQANEVLRAVGVATTPAKSTQPASEESAISLEVVTSGDPAAYRQMLDKLGIPPAQRFTQL